ncbi:hypothetical protein [uncultured Kordia sp.]|uniref:hypothetical protein n=1 Tax=uncultured Kordia sp. TaxID=507699 RepID=UPI0026278AD7|nr:hypothetical protein [uncultured Kordia sp.]
MEATDIIKAFKQGGEGNCVAIAIIKAGIEIFGINKIFIHGWEGNDCKVLMKDDYTLNITKEELTLASEGSKFMLLNDKEVFDYANLCFAVMAKRAQKEENDDLPNMTYTEAIETLNNGEWYTHGADWLGLRYHIKNIKRRNIERYKGAVGASRKHCFFVSEGKEDNYGRVDNINIFERRFCKWFRVTEEEL